MRSARRRLDGFFIVTAAAWESTSHRGHVVILGDGDVGALACESHIGDEARH